MRTIGKDEWLGAFGFVAALALALLLATWAVGCNDGIPIDPACEDLLAHQADEREQFECALPEPDCTDAFNEGFDAGAASVECVDRVTIIVVHPEPGEVECDLSVPVGHRPIECRGNR